MATLLEKLKQKMATQTREQILEIWNSGNHLDNSGPKVRDFLNASTFRVKVESPPENLENFKINDILGSNTYSDLFFILN